jgi:hypothetical protein
LLAVSYWEKFIKCSVKISKTILFFLPRIPLYNGGYMKKFIRPAIMLFIWLAVTPNQGWGGTWTWTVNEFFYKPDVGARGQNEKARFDVALDRVDARLGKAVWAGDPRLGDTIAGVLTAIGTNPAILRVPAGVWSIANNLAVPNNVTLKPERGAILNVPDGITLTINGGVEAGLYQVFSWTGTGKVQFGAASRVKEIFPQWWGAVGDGANNDLTAVQAALNAPAGNCAVKFIKGSYLLDGGSSQYILKWPASHGISLKGEGFGTKLTCKSTHAMPIGIYLSQTGFTANSLTIENLAIQGPSDGVSVPHTLVRFYTSATNITVRNVDFSFAQQTGLGFGMQDYTTSNVLVENSYFHDICTSTFATPGSAVTGFGAQGGNVTFRNCNFGNVNVYSGPSNTAHAIYISQGSNFRIENCYFNGQRARIQSYTYLTPMSNIIISGNISNGVDRHIFYSCSDVLVSKNIFIGSNFNFGNGSSKWKCDNNLFDGNYTGQYAFSSDGNTTNGEFTNNRMVGTALSVYLSGSSNIIFLRNNHIAATTGYTIALDSTGNDFQFIGNYLGSGNASTIRLYEGSGSNYVFQGNTFKPYTGTCTIQNNGSNAATHIVKDNILLAGSYSDITNLPYRGTATLSSGTTAITFPGALADTSYQVNVTGGANETFYVTDKLTTGFTINSSNGSSTAVVDYVVYKNRLLP